MLRNQNTTQRNNRQSNILQSEKYLTIWISEEHLTIRMLQKNVKKSEYYRGTTDNHIIRVGQTEEYKDCLMFRKVGTVCSHRELFNDPSTEHLQGYSSQSTIPKWQKHGWELAMELFSLQIPWHFQTSMTQLTGLDWPRLSYREQFKEGDEEADRGNDRKTTSKSGRALNGIYYYRKLRTARSGGSWLKNLQWYPNGQPDYRIDL